MSDYCEYHEYAYSGNDCPFCEQSVDIGVDRGVEPITGEKSSERVRHLNAIIAHTEALERLYDEDDVLKRHIIQRLRLKAKEIRG